MINFMGASACPLCKPRLMHLGIEKLSQICQTPSGLNEANCKHRKMFYCSILLLVVLILRMALCVHTCSTV